MQSKAKSSPPVAQQCRLTLQAKCARIEGKCHDCGTGRETQRGGRGEVPLSSAHLRDDRRALGPLPYPKRSSWLCLNRPSESVQESSSAEYRVLFWINSTLKFVKVAETWYNSIQPARRAYFFYHRQTQVGDPSPNDSFQDSDSGVLAKGSGH